MGTTTRRFFAIGDLHDGHEKILNIRPFKTVEEQRETLVKNWNKTVTDEDLIFVMGDLALESRSKQREFFAQLRGHKHLIKGNHDLQPTSFYLQYFESVHDILMFNYPGSGTLMVLTHIPMKIEQIRGLSQTFGKRVVNVHAHTHDGQSPDLVGDTLKYPDFYLSTSAEMVDYTPTEFISQELLFCNGSGKLKK